jgi:tripartite-type tricarboxylate transporter receptor subunit TctC
MYWTWRRLLCNSRGSISDTSICPSVVGHFKEGLLKLLRRRFLHVVAAAIALPAVSRFAWALRYPARPVHLLEGFGAGGTPDVVARLISQWLSERLGQSFIVENRTGAVSNIATEAVVRAPPDGYTLLLMTVQAALVAANPTVFKLNFDFVHDIRPVASIARVPYVMVVHPSVPAKTVAEFIAFAKAHPGKLNVGSSGTGGLPHLAAEWFKAMAGVNLFHVPFRGTQVFPAILAGEVQVFFGPLLSWIEYIRAGQLRALAVTTNTRLEVLPDIPILGEALPGYEVSAWFGIGAPKNTPDEIVERLNKEVNASIADPKFMARLANLGGTVLTGSPADFGKFIADETEKWRKVIVTANVKSE